MKIVYCILIFGSILLAASAAKNEGYKIKYDVNLDEILNSDRLLNNYFRCLVDKGKCTPEAADLKSKSMKIKLGGFTKKISFQKSYRTP